MAAFRHQSLAKHNKPSKPLYSISLKKSQTFEGTYFRILRIYRGKPSHEPILDELGDICLHNALNKTCDFCKPYLSLTRITFGVTFFQVTVHYITLMKCTLIEVWTFLNCNCKSKIPYKW